MAVDIDVDVSSSDDSSDDVDMADIVAMTSAVKQPDDSGACCSHDVVPPADAGAAAAGSESCGSGSEDSTSSSSTSPSQSSAADDVSVPMTDTAPATDTPSETTTVSGSSAVVEEQVSVVGGFCFELDAVSSLQK